MPFSLRSLKRSNGQNILLFEASIEIAFNYLAQTEIIDYQAVLKVHEILFSDFYPWAGKDRNELVPHLAVFKGSQDNPVTRSSSDLTLSVWLSNTPFIWPITSNVSGKGLEKSWGY